jgi:hypothetical protein
MRAIPTALFALVFGAVATVPAFGIASVNVFGSQSAGRNRRLHAQRLDQLRENQPGDGFGLDYSQSGWKLDVFIYDLKRAAIPDDAKSAIVKAEFERARAEAFLAQPRGLYAQGLSAAQFHHRRCSQAHALPVRSVPSYPRRLPSRRMVFSASPSWNNKFVKLRLTTLSDNNTETDRAQIRQRLGAGAVGRRRGHLARRAGSRTGPVRAASASTGAAATGSSRAGTAAV